MRVLAGEIPVEDLEFSSRENLDGVERHFEFLDFLEEREVLSGLIGVNGCWKYGA